ncbi:MAG: hypothetical protein R2755_21995 [Acidimicrobiales bacterium]
MRTAPPWCLTKRRLGDARLFLGRFAPRSIGRRRVPLVPANDRLVFQCVHADGAAAAYEAALEPSAAKLRTTWPPAT